jgi:hypothetical protein
MLFYLEPNLKNPFHGCRLKGKATKTIALNLQKMFKTFTSWKASCYYLFLQKTSYFTNFKVKI